MCLYEYVFVLSHVIPKKYTNLSIQPFLKETLRLVRGKRFALYFFPIVWTRN